MKPPVAGEVTEHRAGISRLSDGEVACLKMVASGMQSKEIARALSISPHTVDMRLRSAMTKLKAPSRFVAAQTVAEFFNDNNDKSVGNDPINLIHQNLRIPLSPISPHGRSSPADSNAAEDRSQITDHSAESLQGSEPWNRGRRLSQAVAAFFGEENRLGAGQRTLLIFAMAAAIAIGFGTLVNAALGLSQAISSP